MQVLCGFRHFADHDVGIWNRTLYVHGPGGQESRELNSLSELKAAFAQDLQLPLYPVERVLPLIRGTRGPIFPCT